MIAVLCINRRLALPAAYSVLYFQINPSMLFYFFENSSIQSSLHAVHNDPVIECMKQQLFTDCPMIIPFALFYHSSSASTKKQLKNGEPSAHGLYKIHEMLQLFYEIKGSRQDFEFDCSLFRNTSLVQFPTIQVCTCLITLYACSVISGQGD